MAIIKFLPICSRQTKGGGVRLMGMKQILVLMVAVVLVGQSAVADEKLIADPIVEKWVRRELNKPTGELTNADLAKVTSLILGNTKVTDDGLKNLTNLQNLTYLSLEATRITSAGLKDVAKLQNLKSLFLHETQITDEGLKEVAKLQKLVGLFLNDTKITGEARAELKKALPNCRIAKSKAPNSPR